MQYIFIWVPAEAGPHVCWLLYQNGIYVPAVACHTSFSPVSVLSIVGDSGRVGHATSTIRMKSAPHPARGSLRILLYFEVPKADHRPPKRTQLGVNLRVALLVASNLLVPILLASSLPIARRMAMPEAAVYKDGNSGLMEDEIGGLPGSVIPRGPARMTGKRSPTCAPVMCPCSLRPAWSCAAAPALMDQASLSESTPKSGVINLQRRISFIQYDNSIIRV